MNIEKSFLKQILQKKKKKNNQYKNIQFDILQIEKRFKLQAIQNQKQRIQIKEEQFVYLIKLAKSKIYKQNSLLRLQSPIHIATGTLGSFNQLTQIFKKCGDPRNVNYLFLGDYTGRYNNSIECLVALLFYKIIMPYNFFLLRGCYQSISLTKKFNLYNQTIDYFGSSNVWKQICELFCCLPFAAIVNEKIFCVHGGISEYLISPDQINSIERPIDTCQNYLICDLIWSDPSYLINQGLCKNQRGKSIGFSQDLLQKFMKRSSIQLICRGHQIAQKGFTKIFNNKVVTLCSISNYLNMYNNSSAVMLISKDFNIGFKQINSSNQT